MKKGMMDHPSSSGIEPVIGAPTRLPVPSRYLIVKTSTPMMTMSAKNAVTAVTKKYRLSTSGARLDACSGNSGIPDSICLRPEVLERLARLAAAHQEYEAADEEDRQHPAQPHEVHHHDAIPAALRVVMKTVEEELVDDRADPSLP